MYCQGNICFLGTTRDKDSLSFLLLPQITFHVLSTYGGYIGLENEQSPPERSVLCDCALGNMYICVQLMYNIIYYSLAYAMPGMHTTHSVCHKILATLKWFIVERN